MFANLLILVRAKPLILEFKSVHDGFRRSDTGPYLNDMFAVSKGHHLLHNISSKTSINAFTSSTVL
jgi:hypothetical protein